MALQLYHPRQPSSSVTETLGTKKAANVPVLDASKCPHYRGEATCTFWRTIILFRTQFYTYDVFSPTSSRWNSGNSWRCIGPVVYGAITKGCKIDEMYHGVLSVNIGLLRNSGFLQYKYRCRFGPTGEHMLNKLALGAFMHNKIEAERHRAITRMRLDSSRAGRGASKCTRRSIIR
jgi:hypothetical protein